MHDDDDFIVSDDANDDDEDELPPSSSRPPSRASSSRASSRSRLSDYAMGSTSEPEFDGATGSGFSKKTSIPPAVKKSSSFKNGGNNLFLTAAETRAQRQKEDKKSSEDPFEFLLDVRDKDGVRPGEPGYDPRTLYIPPKVWKTFTPFEKQASPLS